MLDLAADGCIKPNIRTYPFVVTATPPCEHWKVKGVEFTLTAETADDAAEFAQKWLCTGPMHKMIIVSVRRA